MTLLNPTKWHLKTKLLSIVLLVLLIPITSIYLLKKVEEILLDNQIKNLRLSAQLISMQLESHPDWFSEALLPVEDDFVADEFIVFPLQEEIDVDGFFEEWFEIEKYRKSFNVSAESQANSISLLFGSRKNSFYLSARIIDHALIYDTEPGRGADQIVISFIDQFELPRRIFLSPTSEGEIAVKHYIENRFKIDWRYTAFLSETDNGFNIEVKFPDGFKPRQVRVTHYDVDHYGSEIKKDIITSSEIELNPLLWPSESINRFISQIQLLPGQRLWVLDKDRRVISKNGELTNIPKTDSSAGFFGWLLGSQPIEIEDRRNNQLKLNSKVIFQSLKGETSSSLEAMLTSASNREYYVGLVAVPIFQTSEVVGVVFMEENIAKIQLLQEKALGKALNTAAILVLLIIVLVVWYINKISSRIVKLKERVIEATDEHGRLTKPPKQEFIDGDEIDDLTNAFSRMGARLYDYNDYLEKLASRLSHELRTPIAIVRSSLDNLLLDCEEQEKREIIERALNGTERLGDIISRMRQASGVKEAMASAELVRIDLSQFLNNMTEAYQLTFPQYRIELEVEGSGFERDIAPELFAELVDKLISNATDFSKENKPIKLFLGKSGRNTIFSVSNTGKLIPKKDQKRIFNSLVSIREKSEQAGTNLGLGLYIVKLIANFHGARVKAENLQDESGVRINLIWKK